MRFFSGVRGKSGKSSASQLFKQMQNAKPHQKQTPEEKYKKMLEAKIEKLQENAMMGIKASSGFSLPGTKSNNGKPQQMSDNKKKAMEMLSLKKKLKEHKADRKKETEWNRGQKSMLKAKQDAADRAAEEIIEQAKKEAEAAYAAAQSTPSGSSFFFSGGSDDNNGW
jgi:hypothetical protein